MDQLVIAAAARDRIEAAQNADNAALVRDVKLIAMALVVGFVLGAIVI